MIASVLGDVMPTNGSSERILQEASVAEGLSQSIDLLAPVEMPVVETAVVADRVAEKKKKDKKKDKKHGKVRK